MKIERWLELHGMNLKEGAEHFGLGNATTLRRYIMGTRRPASKQAALLYARSDRKITAVDLYPLESDTGT